MVTWSRIFGLFGLDMDNNLLNILITKDKTKKHKRIRSQTNEWKIIRSTVKYENLAACHKAQMSDLKRGDQYESGIPMTAAKKS